ncbi:RNA polymerase sigma factor [Mucilaginibacter ginkgonis]|uniref:Sigma-70 family RNA polymerase sigma factor n=1 Tax=Mucilaginibacter ginkgonis TaxID=2682091 RepID=A0A6I4HYI2_9SPHI|nr:sigma-70 family RNA polymerase sigma factor [Mucilaginibacter ginkgonis]QQL51409.1 sigma-70 family RNA polymerase sigma factor [Mucilaginibacter ginkgonis]
MQAHPFPVDAQQREEFFLLCYKQTFPAVAAYVAKRGGSFEDAKDIFQDAVVIYYEHFVNNKTEPHNRQAYLMGVAKNLWLRKFNSEKMTTPIEQITDLPVEESEDLSETRVLNFLEKAGKKCLELLRAFYYDKVPHEELAGQFGFSGVRSATVQKYKCLEKVRDTVKQKQLQYADFVE